MRIIFLYLSLLVCTAGYAKPLKIVTSIAPLNALAAGVAADVSQPTMLVSPQTSHHHFALTPSSRQALEQADVVIWVGENLETFLSKSLSNVDEKNRLISIMDLPDLKRLPLRNHEQVQKLFDTHVWLSPFNANVIINALSKKFSELDPQNKEKYQLNAKKMIQKINALDQQLKTQLQTVQNKPYLVYHDAYQYFEQYYQLDFAGAISINDVPPSTKRIYELQQEMKQKNIHCLLADRGNLPAIVETLANSNEARINYLDATGKGQDFADYLHMLQYNADSFSQCLND